MDFSDNLCYEDRCDVLTAKGYCIYFDEDHMTTISAKNWLNVVDYLTEF